jgi:hypothetical protein
VARKAGQATMDAYFNTFSDNSQMIDWPCFFASQIIKVYLKGSRWNAAFVHSFALLRVQSRKETFWNEGPLLSLLVLYMYIYRPRARGSIRAGVQDAGVQPSSSSSTLCLYEICTLDFMCYMGWVGLHGGSPSSC